MADYDKLEEKLKKRLADDAENYLSTDNLMAVNDLAKAVTILGYLNNPVDMTMLDTGMGTIQTQLTQLNQDINTFNSKVNTNIDATQTQLIDLASEISTIKSYQSNLSSKINSIASVCSTISTIITEMSSRNMLDKFDKCLDKYNPDYVPPTEET